MIAETNRTPFDLPEAEAELVAGYNTDYASMAFAIFFLAEYANMIFMSTLFAFFFLGGCSAKISGLVFKILCLSVIFVIVRAALPRYRYDQLMDIG
jgi:NADH-quinone oxidoreductase subunit H